MSFNANSRGGFNAGGSRPEIPRDRPPLDLVLKEGCGKVLFLENPKADIPEFEFRILAHPEATESDFLLEIAPDAPKSDGVTDAFCRYPRIAVLDVNSRKVYLRTDVSSKDSLDNTVTIAVTGKEGHRREKMPWDLLVDKMEMLSKLTLGALERGIDVGMPVDWMGFFEATRFGQGKGAKREVIDDLLKKAELRREFKMSGDRLLMQGILTIDATQRDKALKYWPWLSQARVSDNGDGSVSFHDLVFSPPSGAVSEMLAMAFSKKNARAPISLTNSMLGDVYTYANGAPIKITRLAKDSKAPAEGLNVKYGVSTGMPQQLPGAFKASFRDWDEIIGPAPKIEDHMEEIVRLFEDAVVERTGAGARFLPEKLSTLRALFKAVFTGTVYEMYLPQRVVDAPDMMPPELQRGWSTTYISETGEEKTAGFYYYLKSLPVKVRLSDQWFKNLAIERRRRAVPAAPPPAPQAPVQHRPEGVAPVPPRPKFGPAAQPKSFKSAPPPVADEDGDPDWSEVDDSVAEAVDAMESPADDIPYGNEPARVQQPPQASAPAPAPVAVPRQAAPSAAPAMPPPRQAPPPPPAKAPVPPPVSAVAPKPAETPTPGFASGGRPPPPPPPLGRR